MLAPFGILLLLLVSSRYRTGILAVFMKSDWAKK